MGMRTTTAANQSDQGDFNSAFADIISEKTEVNEPVETPEGEETEETQEAPKADDPLDKIEESTKAAREKWKLQKENKELKARLEKLEEDSKKGINVDSDNPLKDLGKMKGWSKEDIVQKALDALEDDGMTEEQAEKKVKSMTEEEIIAKVKAELKKEMEAEAEEKGKISKAEEAINKFKENISKFAKENAEKYPLIDGLGGSDSVFRMIAEDYEANEKEFGIEYAQKNIMKIDVAAKKINEMLATNVKNALKSEHVKKFILAAIKEGGESGTKDTQLEDIFQLKDEEPETLTNSVHKRVTDPKDSRELTEDERFEQAFAYLKN